MTSLTHEITFLAHEGGTKFYEVAQLYNADGGKYILVKRWGKMGQRVRGGEIKIEEYNSGSRLRVAADKALRDKQSRGYSIIKPDAGGALHTHNSSYTSEAEFKDTIVMHYGPNGPRVFANLTGQSTYSVDDERDDSIVVEEPQPEPDRGNTWGSW
jgi:predicted DNA-binding WGR domain protein